MTELEKWSKVADDARVINEFIDNLLDLHATIVYDQGHFLTRTELIYKHFGIDPQKLEEERRELLKEAQHYNNSSQENRP